MRSLCILVVLTGLALAGSAQAGEQIVLGTGPVAGVYYPAGGALCRLINGAREQHGLRCLVESTAGSEDNLRRLRARELDLAIVQSDWQYYAGQGVAGGDGAAEGEGRPADSALRAVVSLYAQPFTLVARPGSGIGALEDLEGKRFSMGPAGSSQHTAGGVLIEALGWTRSDFAEVAELAPDDQVAALCAGRIDALLMPASHPNGVIGAATGRCGARLVPIDGQAVDALVASWPFYSRAVIPGSVYPGNPDPVASFGLRATVITGADTPEEAVYWLVRILFEGLDAYRRQHPALAGLSPADMVSRGNTLALHAGALRYYRERGWKQ